MDPVDEVGSVNIAAGATTTILTVTVPAGTRFILTGFANYAGQTAAFGNLTWRYKVNGLPIPPLHNVRDQLGEQIHPRPIASANCNAHGGDVVTVEAYNASTTTAYDAAAVIQGRFERA